MFRRLARFLLRTRKKNWAAPLARVPLGLIFMGHGAQKLFGWFGGRGLKATVDGFEQMGIPRRLGVLNPFAEFFGGLGVLAGFLTRPSALGIAISMGVAIAKVHGKQGFFMNWENKPGKGHGMEANLAFAGTALALVFAGGGALSVDGCLSRSPDEGEILVVDEIIIAEEIPEAARGTR